MFRRLSPSSSLPPSLSLSGQAQQAPRLADLKTTAESSGYKSTSTYDDVVRFMKAVDEASPLVHYTTYGKTSEGRDMPMAVVGTGLKDASPASVRGTGRLRVHIQGNIHAGEVEGKEAAQVLLRELPMGQHADWLRSMVFLDHADFQRRRQREVRADQPPAPERADQRHGHARSRGRTSTSIATS